MNTESIYFLLLCALLFVIVLLYALGALWERLSRILTPIALGLHLPLAALVFLCEGELRVLLLTALISACLYTLSRFIKYIIGRRVRRDL